jgi:hypothetical protein
MAAQKKRSIEYEQHLHDQEVHSLRRMIHSLEQEALEFREDRRRLTETVEILARRCVKGHV